MKKTQIRTRIAPSPTGKIHVGTIRTALFNFLFARNQKGKFIIRIEDTDLERSTKEFEEMIFKGLAWAGLTWDEGPDIGGEYGPYRQSERLRKYQKYAAQLLAEKKAYYCYCTQEELEAERKIQQTSGKPYKYSRKCATLSEKQKKQAEAEGRKKTVRFYLPKEKIVYKDLVRGNIEFDTALQSDPIILKSNLIPTFNFANVIDDFEMNISHVIRGEEFIPSMPQQIFFNKALNFVLPQFAHIPLILNPDRTKMSKRRNEGILEEYINLGYLPEAMLNFLVLLGWSPGNNQEIFTLNELIRVFSISGLQPNPATMQKNKLDWFNSHYIRRLKINELRKRCSLYIPSKWQKNIKKLEKILTLIQERLNNLSEVKERIAFVFEEIQVPEKILIPSKKTAKESSEVLDQIIKLLEKISWNHASLENFFRQQATKFGWTTGELFMLIRIAVTGNKTTPPLFDTLLVLEKELSIKRLHNAKNILASL